jgi:hypothetical protein
VLLLGFQAQSQCGFLPSSGFFFLGQWVAFPCPPFFLSQPVLALGVQNVAFFSSLSGRGGGGSDNNKHYRRTASST